MNKEKDGLCVLIKTEPEDLANKVINGEVVMPYGVLKMLSQKLSKMSGSPLDIKAVDFSVNYFYKDEKSANLALLSFKVLNKNKKVVRNGMLDKHGMFAITVH